MSDNRTIEYREERNLMPTIDEIATAIQRRVDQAVLDKAADMLAEFGYVKVIRCKDCKRFGYLGDDMCYLPNGDGGFAGWKVDPEGFCAWGER